MKETHVLTRTCHAYIEFITKITKISSNRYILKDGTSCFGFIPYDASISLIKDLRKIKSYLCRKGNRTPKFIDIGCGIGNIVLLAVNVGYKSTGLEYNSKIYKVAREICKHTRNTEIIKGDMRKFDKYHEYDVLYYYQPMITYTEMIKFSTKLAEQMKPGAYLICNYFSESFENSKDFYQVGKRDLWRKKPIKNKRRN